MRTVITISLNGNAYQLDAVGYDALRAYLQVAEQRLAGNPTRRRFSRISSRRLRTSATATSDLIRTSSSPKRWRRCCGRWGRSMAGRVRVPRQARDRQQVPTRAQVLAGPTHPANTPRLLERPGPPTVEVRRQEQARARVLERVPRAPVAQPQAALRRLYQIRDGAVISGVCKGLAAYLNIDVAVIRTLFVVLAIVTGGAWVLVYVVMMFVIPFAQTSEQHAAAHGWPFNAEEVIARAKSHYAAFKESEKWRRQQSREQRRMWKDQRKQWRDERRAWERAGGAYGAPPPPPPPWSSAPPPNATYSSQVVNGVMTPLIDLVGAVLFIAFLIALASIAMHHRVFGWSLPWDMPTWVGIVALIVLYKVLVSPLRQARYSAYYGAPLGQGWVALFAVSIWLAAMAFMGWLAWQHWTEVQGFFEQFTSSLRD